MRIALDAMGADLGPRETVLGAAYAAPSLPEPLYLVGDEAILGPLVPKGSPIEIVHAPQTVTMHDKPTDAYRKKKDSSLMVATRLVKEGKAAAMVSAGNTGAAVTFSLLSWRPVEGVHRPAIASRFPNRHGGFMMLDTGASPDADPEHILEFARMGRIYAQRALDRPHPKVHLLNIGEEEGKGSLWAKRVYDLLKPYDWFAGNIEGKDMWTTPCDVIVCDAFVGNIVLKTSEGLAEYIANLIKAEVPQNPLMRSVYWPVKQATRPLREQMDYAEIGGSPLLGLNGLCMIAHGRSDARAIKNAVLLTQKMVEMNVVGAIGEDAHGSVA